MRLSRRHGNHTVLKILHHKSHSSQWSAATTDSKAGLQPSECAETLSVPPDSTPWVDSTAQLQHSLHNPHQDSTPPPPSPVSLTLARRLCNTPTLDLPPCSTPTPALQACNKCTPALPLCNSNKQTSSTPSTTTAAPEVPTWECLLALTTHDRCSAVTSTVHLFNGKIFINRLLNTSTRCRLLLQPSSKVALQARRWFMLSQLLVGSTRLLELDSRSG